ncbi:response regulator [Streptomyces acidiscabies]|uniref:Response regulator transcription factor n=1 Tax=Streptomyces acidiscabies TaxID=42234 RepID=A0AAP6EG98_9ACTN|nr:response regulator transcription factor [Streptomyces acidiscabies]MBP5942474.1 response regulator transcription factor [Streptomyces sp. LBUM 1476]MBZ3917775.1 response regulator transcription factor [Streptomyces acidiscabies]MDX2961743.1 response regulator transcription factor [Streptomyces acidiscabies]MDX3023510.1 response regulator transcription factor [Streptomyces acidiscabies]MDX3789284.1 response regulator transcription factor [Streptomyces acidiscabies]
MTIRVLLADGQALVRSGFRMFLQAEPDLEVVGEAATGGEAVALARGTRADVVLMDVRMPGMDGLAATRAITSDENLTDVRVLILTAHESDDHVVRALRAGAGGFLGKGVEPAALLSGIRMVARGETPLSPTATKALITRYLALPDPANVPVPELRTLTERESQVLGLVAAGLSNHAIGDRLRVSPLTAKTHVNHIMAKLDAHDRARLVAIAYRTGFTRPRATPGEERPEQPWAPSR